MDINKKWKIPDREECLNLMDKFNMLPNIKRHSIKVCELALSIAKELNGTGANLNLDHITAASLLHDLTKTKSLKTGEDHAETASQVLNKLGYKRIAEIVRAHIIPKEAGKELTEEEIINYADKRVLHDRVVSLEERFEYLIKRYGENEKNIKRIMDLKEKTKIIENNILKKINLKSFV
jgi:putative nucleotidyltransferase with HDIG domain